MEFWRNILYHLRKRNDLVLLFVIQSKGSSPGRRGFKMAVSSNGDIFGSIGGGVMEHKLVELSRTLLKDGFFKPFVKHQIHKTNIKKDKSGMICSGSQSIAFYHLNDSDVKLMEQIIQAKANNQLILEHNGISIDDGALRNIDFNNEMMEKMKWRYVAPILKRDTLFLIGGGHVGLAFSKLMYQLGFHIVIIDNRDDLNTMNSNKWVHKKLIINYEEIEKYVDEGSNNYVVIMSFGYKWDKIILNKLIKRKYKYVGMMGSQSKVDRLFGEIKDEGIDENYINKVYSPIGVFINSKTPMEIAVSIAAEIIRIKNEALS